VSWWLVYCWYRFVWLRNCGKAKIDEMLGCQTTHLKWIHLRRRKYTFIYAELITLQIQWTELEMIFPFVKYSTQWIMFQIKVADFKNTYILCQVTYNLQNSLRFERRLQQSSYCTDMERNGNCPTVFRVCHNPQFFSTQNQEVDRLKLLHYYAFVSYKEHKHF
jgi:hypothetical protein